MSKNIWMPDTNDPELLNLYTIFESSYLKFNLLKTRIARFEIEIEKAEKEQEKLINNINNLKQIRSKIVSIREFNSIKKEIKLIKTFIKNKKECIIYDNKNLNQIQKELIEVQKKIDARQANNVIPFRKR
jgi:hypothetical protein